VPIIGVPVYGDQYNNLLQVQEAGFGKLLEFHDINEEVLSTLLHEVLNNESFRIKAKELSHRFKDRPMSPLDTAIYWIEYVIRNKGAGYMKNPGLTMNWFAYNMIDVYAFILLVIALCCWLVVYVISSLSKLFVTTTESKYQGKEMVNKKKKI
jgi:glucuronosyltransferase